MKTAKKILTASEVTANLNNYFPGKNGICTEVFNDGIRNFILIEFKGTNFELLIQDKKVFYNARLQPGRANDYYEHCKTDYINDRGQRVVLMSALPLIQKQVGKEIYIPFIYNKKTASKAVIEQEKLILVCCNQARPKAKNLNPSQFIRKHAGSKYADIYKVIAELSKTQDLKAIFDVNKDIQGREWVALRVEHKTGFYKFMLTDIGYKTKLDKDTENDIIRLFIDLLLPENIVNNPLVRFEPKPAMVISAQGKLKLTRLCNRLKRNYSIAA